MEEHNERLTVLPSPPRPAAPLCERFISGTTAAFRFWLLINVPLIFCICKPLFIQDISGTNKRRYTGQQAGTKSGRGPANKPVVNRSLCFSVGLHRVSFVVLPKSRSGQRSSMPWGARWSVVISANRPVDVLSCPASTRPLYIRVLDSTVISTIIFSKHNLHLSIPKPGHTTGGSGRGGAGRGGGAARRRVKRRRVGSHRTQPSRLLSGTT